MSHVTVESLLSPSTAGVLKPTDIIIIGCGDEGQRKMSWVIGGQGVKPSLGEVKDTLPPPLKVIHIQGLCAAELPINQL